MAPGIPTGFVRKLYRILDHESAAVIAWDDDGTSFSIHDSAALDAQVLPRYFRGRLAAFRQQLLDHGFQRRECEEDEDREVYCHPSFRRGCPGELSKIERKPQKSKKRKAPDTALSGSLSLKVQLHMPPLEDSKRKKPKNPLFSDDPDSSLSLAKFVEGSALLPASSELPDPISYLNKGEEQAKETMPPMFSDDMVKSALFFLVSSTGVDSNGKKDETTTSAAPALTAATTSSSFLASLLASSTTGGSGTASFAGKNPLFSDQATDGDDDSIWNLLVASSVDRVRSAITTVTSPQEKLQLILDEREKLEEQRKKVGAPAGPIVPRKAASDAQPAPEASPAKQNPLFSKEPAGAGLHLQDPRAGDDDLWKLLMSSSIDSFRRVTDMEL